MSLVSKIFDSDIFIGNEDPMFDSYFEQEFNTKLEEEPPKQISFNPQQTYDVILFHQQENVKEYIPNVVIHTAPNGDIDLKGLITVIDSMGLLYGPSMFYYFSYLSDMYIYCGQDPLPTGIVIPAKDILFYNDRKVINLKIRLVEESLQLKTDFQLGDDLEIQAGLYLDLPSTASNSSESDKDSNSVDCDEKKRRTRHKERKIGEVLELVLKWRKLYAGVRDPITGLIIKLSLDEAAKKLGVAKKSLDDYLLQIRHAKLYGFDFQSNHDERIGMLRAFVKKFKNGSTTNNQTDAFDDDLFDDKKVVKVKNSKKISKKAPAYVC